MVFGIDTDTWIAIGAIMSGVGSFTMGLMAVRLARRDKQREQSNGGAIHEVAESSDPANGGVT